MTGKRQPLVAGNWKMNRTSADGMALLQALRAELDAVTAVEIRVCPPFTLLPIAKAALAGSRIALGAQDLCWMPGGAFTGQISAAQLRDVGCSLVIVGHSERRHLLGETDELVHKKALAALAGHLTPIVCVGETLAERQAGETTQVVLRQTSRALDALAAKDLAKVVIAYEPVWAIGTGATASPEQAQEVHGLLRGYLAKRGEAASVRILYGGSVKPDNAAALFAQPDVDGALVGGASLVATEFSAIVKAAVEVG